MKTLRGFAALLVLAVASAVWSHAQDKQELQSLVLGEALPALALPLVDEAALPDTGTFWSAQFAEVFPPYPFLPLRELDLRVYAIGRDQFLYDDRAVDYTRLAQVQQVLQMAERAAKGLPLEEEAPAPLLLKRGLVPTGTDLLLDLEEATNGVASLTIYLPDALTNSPPPFDLWCATNFSGNPDNWIWLAQTEPGQTNLLAAMPSETEAYFRLGATNNDMDGDGILDSWMSQHFGHVTAWASDHTLATDDYDGDGIGNYAEFLAGTEPNDIRFLVSFPENYTSSTSPAGSAEVLSGHPSQIVALVDTDPFGLTTAEVGALPWLACPAGAQMGSLVGISPTLPTDGWHTVWVGMAGRSSFSKIMWNSFRLKLDRVAPAIHLITPVTTNATVPYRLVQIQGYADERLSIVTYDLSSSSQTITNALAFVTSESAARSDFQVFDINLASGTTNLLALHVWDEAGNKTDATFALQVATNTPAPTNAGIVWPADGTLIAGDSCSVVGATGDPGSTVIATITDEQANATTLAGHVDRSGNYSITNVPIHSGQNTLSVTVTDGLGRSVTTSRTLQRASYTVSATMGDLRRLQTTVSGTIAKIGSVPDIQSATVNQQSVTVNAAPNQDWSNVTVAVDKDASVFRLKVVLTPVSGTNVEWVQDFEKPAYVRIDRFAENFVWGFFGCNGFGFGDSYSMNSWTDATTATASDFWWSADGVDPWNATTTFQMPADRFLVEDAFPLWAYNGNVLAPGMLQTPSKPVPYSGLDNHGNPVDLGVTTNTFVVALCTNTGGYGGDGYARTWLRAPVVRSSYRDVDLKWPASLGGEVEFRYKREAKDTSLVLETSGQPGEKITFLLALRLRTVNGDDYDFEPGYNAGYDASPAGVALGKLGGVTDSQGLLVAQLPGGSHIEITPQLKGDVLKRVTRAEPDSGKQFAWADMDVTATKITTELVWMTKSNNIPIDNNPNPGGGKRIFVGALTPTESNLRNTALVKFKLTPPVPGITVFFRSFDVDDPSTNTVIDPNGDAGNDNNVDFGLAYISPPGYFSLTVVPNITAVTDTNGEAVVEFTAGTQPGNNYRVAAALDYYDLNLLTVTDPQSKYYLPPSNAPVAAFPGVLSPMLTVWRKLHIEVDSMEAVATNGAEANFETGVVQYCQADIPTNGQTRITTTSTLLGGDAAYESGRLEIAGVGSFPVINSERNYDYNNQEFQYLFYVQGTLGTNLQGQTFTLYDDDDRFLSTLGLPPPLPKDDESTNVIAGIHSVFRPAYIDVVNANAEGLNSNKRIPFKRNASMGLTGAGVYDDAKDLHGSIAFWSHTVTFGYQGDTSEDKDPYTESPLLGTTLKMGGLFEGGVSTIFVETLRDGSIDSYQQSQINNTNLTYEISQTYWNNILGVTAHEIGHAPGSNSEPSDHGEGDLMEGGRSHSIDSEEFAPETIKRFRMASQW